MTGDKAIRMLTAAAVLVVAAIAATVSFLHIEHLAVTYGQTATGALLLPVSVDGTVAASSLTMLRAARAGLPTPGLARVMLGLAVAATLGANIGYGLPYGWQGALISGWPAVAFIGCAEMAIGMVRRARSQPASSTEIPVPEVPATMNGHAEKAAVLFAPDLARGEVPGVRRIRRELRIGTAGTGVSDRARERQRACLEQDP